MGCIHILRGKLNPIFQVLSENKVLKHNIIFLTTSFKLLGALVYSQTFPSSYQDAFFSSLT